MKNSLGLALSAVFVLIAQLSYSQDWPAGFSETQINKKVSEFKWTGPDQSSALDLFLSFQNAQAEGNPRDPVDTNRLDYLLCYSQLFGIADKLTEKWSPGPCYGTS